MAEVENEEDRGESPLSGRSFSLYSAQYELISLCASDRHIIIPKSLTL